MVRVFFYCLFFFLSGVGWAQSEVEYDIVASFSPEGKKLEAEAKIRFKNTTSTVLKELFFQLEANQRLKFEIREVLNEEGLVLPAFPYRYTFLNSSIEDPSLYQVSLSTPLEPNQTQTLTFRYVLKYIPAIEEINFLIDDVN